MADNLIFPVKFDLEAAVRRAQGDADKYLRQLENTLRQKPIKLDVAIDGAAPGSIDSISKRMSALSQEFNKLAEAQRVYNRASGEFTPEAQKIIKEYAELTAATQTYAQSLSQITAAAKRQTQEQMKAQEQEIKRYEEYWKRKEAENAKQAQQEVANAERARKAQQQRISQEQAADAKRYQEWLRQKNREFAAQRQAEQQRQQAISASLRTEYQRIEAKKQAEAASRRELQMLNQQYAAEERRQRLAASQASIAKRQQVIKTLRAEENTIVNITAKLQHWQQVMNSSAMDGRQFRRAAEEVQRLSQKLSEAQARISQLTSTTSNASARQTAAVRQVSQEFNKQDSYLTNLLKKTTALWSINQVGNFITQVREVTAQFELQRVSLGAILQDQNKANQLFSEIKSFALKSPVSILDLTKYTKQLAAYKIGYDELFETTKKLTDVSVGLGVSMDRVVLAYGQVRATGHLRASEVRQFTEMGVPIVEELAAKLSKMNGEMVTSAQVMDMISKRAISFDMVKEVFDDMTSAGGIFYNMQEKQGNTLYGLWAKLGDAASVMYSEIGNTGPVNDGMKSLISGLTSLMKNWRLVAGEAMVAVASFGAYKAIQALTVVSTEASTKATQRLMAAKNGLTAAQNRLTAAQRLGNKAAIRHANLAVLEAQWTVKAATANRLAANATNVWTAAKYRLIAATSQLKAAVAGNWIMLTIAAVAAIGVAIAGAIEKATRLKRALDDIESSTINLQNQSVGRFEHLAEAAVNAADGSKKQRDALAELSRTYGDILPQDALKLENLQKLDHKYGKLTATLKEYIAVQQKNKGMEEISNEYGGKINEASKKAIDSLVDYVGVERDVAINIVGEMQRDIQEKLEKGERDFRTTGQKLQAAAAKFGVKISDSLAISMTSKNWYDNWYDRIGLGMATNEFQALTEAVAGQYNELDEWNKRVDASTGATGAWSKELEAAKKRIDELPLTNPDGSPIDNSTFQGSQIKANETMKVVADLINNDTQIKDAIKKKEVEWNNDWIHLVGSVDPKNLMDITTVNFDAIIEALDKKHPEFADKIRDIQNEWGNVAPTNATAVQIKYKMGQIADAFKVSMDKMQKYLWDGSGSVDDYLKRLKDQQAELNARLKEKQQQLLNMGVMSKWWNKLLGNDIEAEVEQMKKEVKALDTLIPFVTGYTIPKKDKNKGGRTSDPRLQNLKEEISLTKKLYDEYHKLEKQIGATKAAEKIHEIYSNTIKTLQGRAAKYGFEFELPFTDENLKSNMQHFIDKMKELQKLRNKKGKPLFPNIGKEIDEAVAQLEDVDLNSLQKALEKKLKELSDRISRTKTAKEFYEKTLGMTGDIQLSANLTVSVYGQNGQDLQDAIREQIRTAFETDPEKNTTIDLSEAIDPGTGVINYNKLAELEEKYKDVLIDGRADLRKKLIDEGRKTSEAQAQQWLKDIEKAKDFAQQRIDLATYTANQIAAINARTDLPQADKDKLIKGYQDREAKQLAKLQYDEFKDSAMYVHIFEDLDHASTTALKNMRDRLIALKGQWKNLDPAQVKELTKAIADLDEQIAGRSPFKSILDGFKGLAAARPQKVIDAEMIAATDELAKREEALADATKKLTEAQTAQVNAQAEVAQARQDLEDALAVSGGEETAEVKAAREVLGIKIATFNAVKAASKDSISAAKKEVDKAADKYEEQKKVIDKLVEEGKLREANIKKIELANQKIDEYQQQINEALDGIRKMMEAFGASDEDMQFFDDVVGSLNEIVDAGQQAAMSVASFMSGNILGGITSGVSAIGGLVSGFANLFSAGKVRKANKEIKRQQELLEQLEYTYGRLEKAADKVFGRDYLNNYNQQLKNLQAQQEAYQKQAEAERSKGKKADEGKIKEYENQARETADAIKELQDDLVAHFTGQSRTDAARQMAKSWIDARSSMSDTFAAIKGDYQDLIKNMIVEGAAARVIENALSPMWDKMDAMLKDNNIDGAIDALVGGMDSALNAANNGMEVLWQALEAKGYDMKKLIGDTDSEYTGIAKNVAGATSEEINNVAAIGNTLMYYVSPIPRIDENLARVVAIMEGRGASAIPQTTSTGWTDWQQQAMDNYNAIARNTADTVIECRRAADACEKLARAVKTKGSTTGFNTFLNS